MEKLWDTRIIKPLLGKYGFKFSKNLGQNFIINPDVCPKMAQSCANSPDSGVLEIGPGIGVLTAELAKRFKKVVCIEIDKKLIPILSETTSDFDNVKIINNDILKINLQELIEKEFKNFSEITVCANLPYYITSDIIMHILEENPGFKAITVMVQKEAAQRICAVPGTRQSGSISLAIRYYGTPQMLFPVPSGYFLPAPKVDSCVIKITVNNSKPQNINNKKSFLSVVHAAYSKRRKNLANSLSSGLGIPKIEVLKILELAKVSPLRRAEELEFKEFCEIANIFAAL